MNLTTKVLQIIPDLGLGGAEIMVEHLSTELKKKGYDVNIISLYNYHSAITERLEKRQVPIIYLNKKKGLDWKIIFRLSQLMKKIKPDVVHTHLYAAPYAMIAAIFAGIPIKVHTIHNIATKEESKPKRIINGLFYKYCQVIPVSISPLVKRTILEEYHLKENQTPMIYNGIDFEKSVSKVEYVSNNDKISIVHVGSFKEQKNHLGLIASFRLFCDEFPDSILNLIGSGALEKQTEDYVKELGLGNNVLFLGLKANVYPFLNSADIFVLPSLWEGMPISLIEAMASGLPIVATRVGGVPDMIEDHISGLLVDVNNEDIAAALIELASNAELRKKLGSTARLAAKRFTAKKMTEQYIELYEKTIESKNKYKQSENKEVE